MRYERIDVSSWPDQIGHAEFVDLLRKHLPEVYAQIDETEAGLLHCEMGVLERATLHAYNERLIANRRYFDFANEVLKRATPEVLNALAVSHIEGLVLGSPEEQRARERMPQELGRFYDEFAEEYERKAQEYQRQRNGT